VGHQESLSLDFVRLFIAPPWLDDMSHQVSLQTKTNRCTFQDDQRMLHVEQLFQIYLEQLPQWLLCFALGRIIFPRKLL